MDAMTKSIKRDNMSKPIVNKLKDFGDDPVILWGNEESIIVTGGRTHVSLVQEEDIISIRKEYIPELIKLLKQFK